MIVNRNSKEIKELSRKSIDNKYVTVEDKRFYFTKVAKEFCNIQVGDFIHFDNNDNEWSFWINDDRDGFSVIDVPRGNRGVIVANVALVRLFRKTTGFNSKASFTIEKTLAVHDKCPIFKIKTDKPRS